MRLFCFLYIIILRKLHPVSHTEPKSLYGLHVYLSPSILQILDSTVYFFSYPKSSCAHH